MASLTERGFSDEARFIEERTSKYMRRLQKSAFGTESVLRDELATVWNEVRQPDWDGHDALPVEQDTLRNTYVFLESLPFGFPRPSVGAEPDGQLTLEWRNSDRRILSVSVSPDDELHYAALLGASRVAGTEPFFGEIPSSILDLIRKVAAC